MQSIQDLLYRCAFALVKVQRKKEDMACVSQRPVHHVAQSNACPTSIEWLFFLCFLRPVSFASHYQQTHKKRQKSQERFSINTQREKKKKRGVTVKLTLNTMPKKLLFFHLYHWQAVSTSHFLRQRHNNEEKNCNMCVTLTYGHQCAFPLFAAPIERQVSHTQFTA